MTQKDNVVNEFANRAQDALNEVVREAHTVYRAAIENTKEPEIVVDIDGVLSFDLRSEDGALILAELDSTGKAQGVVYDKDNNEIDNIRNGSAIDIIIAIVRCRDKAREAGY